MRNRLVKGLAVLGISAILTFHPGAHALAAYNTYTMHTVISGETLWKISVKYNVSIDAIMNANNISGTNIAIGQQLKIPVVIPDSVIEYTVKSGDVLWKIADAHKVTIQAIVDLNKIDPYKPLMLGQKIYIPASTSVNTSGDYDVHTVVSGDTLWKIAEFYKVSIQQIVDLNNIDPNTSLRIGQKLYIPKKPVVVQPAPEETNTIHTVVSGDAVWKIGIKYNVSAQDILDANNLSESSTLYIGQKLIIPSSSGTTQPQVPPASVEPYITYIEHTVQKGDIIWNLSIQYGIPQAELLKANNLTVNSMLSVGQKLTVPVHHVPVTSTPGSKYGEYLDWWTQAQYIFPIGAKAKVTDFATGKSYNIIRSTGANHADCEPLTAQDAAIMYEIWGNQWSWAERASIVEVNGRKIAASVANMPHDIENIKDNNFTGHFDIHFKNSTRHVDGLVNQDHQTQIKIAAGVK